MPRKKELGLSKKRGRKPHFEKIMEDTIWDVLVRCVQNDCSLIQTASLCKCSTELVEREVKARTGTHFSAFRAEMAEAGINLRMVQGVIDLALQKKSLEAMKWYMKNKMGWAEKTESSNVNLSHVQIEDQTEYRISWQDEEPIDVTGSKPQIP